MIDFKEAFLAGLEAHKQESAAVQRIDEILLEVTQTVQTVCRRAVYVSRERTPAAHTIMASSRCSKPRILADLQMSDTGWPAGLRYGKAVGLAATISEFRKEMAQMLCNPSIATAIQEAAEGAPVL